MEGIQIQIHSKIAGKCIKYDDLERAIKHLDKAIDEYPDIPQAWIMKTHCFLQSERIDQIPKLLNDSTVWTTDANPDIKSKMALTWGRYYLTKINEENLKKANDYFIESLLLDNRNLEAGFQLLQSIFIRSNNFPKKEQSVLVSKAFGLNLLIQLGDIDPLFIRRFETDPVFKSNPKSVAETEIIVRQIYLKELKASVAKLEDFLYKAGGLLHHDIFKDDMKKIDDVIGLCKKCMTKERNTSFLCETVHRSREVCDRCVGILAKFINTFSEDYRSTIRLLKDNLKFDKRYVLDLKELRKHKA